MACAGALANDLRLQEGLAMKRLLVLFAVLVPLSFFVAGCGGMGGSSGKSAQPTEEQKQKMQKEMQEQMKKMQGGMQGGVPGGAPTK